jgi:hypothetical protein
MSDECWDDDPVPPKEEPDCPTCYDSGCPACEPHPKGCDCAECADGHVIVHELLNGDANPLQPAPHFLFGEPSADESPF